MNVFARLLFVAGLFCEALLLSSCASTPSRTPLPPELGRSIPQVAQNGDGASFVQFTVPYGPLQAPCLGDIITASDGTYWFANGCNDEVGYVSNSGVMNAVAFGAHTQPSSLVQAGRNIWVLDQSGDNDIYRVSLQTHSVTTFVYSGRTTVAQTNITADSNGDVFFASAGQYPDANIVRLDTSGKMRTYQIPAWILPPASQNGGGVDALLVGPDGNLWFSVENARGRFSIVRLNEKGGTFTSFPLPSNVVPFSKPCLYRGSMIFPGFVAESVADLRPLLVKVTTSGKVASLVDATTHVTPDSASFRSCSEGPGGLLWTIEGSALVFYDEASGKFGEPISSPEPPFGFLEGLAYGPDGNLWTTGSSSGSIDVYSGNALIVSPRSIAFSATGQSREIFAREGNLQTALTATSSNPAIASVTALFGNQFLVTAQGTGTATVTISDKNGIRNANYVRIPVSVK